MQKFRFRTFGMEEHALPVDVLCATHLKLHGNSQQQQQQKLFLLADVLHCVLDLFVRWIMRARRSHHYYCYYYCASVYSFLSLSKMLQTTKLYILHALRVL